MKNILILVCLCAFLGAKGQDFRNAKFGMTKQQVISTETLSLKNIKQFLMSVEKEVIGGRQMQLIYTFDDNGKLKYGMYSETVTGGGEAVNSYNALYGLLQIKYGEPFSSGKVWKTESSRLAYGEDSNYDGFCIETGAMSPNAVWKSNGVEIVISITKIETSLSVGVLYQKETEPKPNGIDKL